MTDTIELREIHADGSHAGDHTIKCPDCRADGYTSDEQHCPTCSCELLTGRPIEDRMRVECELTPADKAEQTHRLAKEFARLMTEALHPDVFSLVNALNGGRKYEATSCASQEFLDANEVMLEAMSNLGIEFAPENEENATLTNEAWQIAKVMNFTL